MTIAGRIKKYWKSPGCKQINLGIVAFAALMALGLTAVVAWSYATGRLEPPPSITVSTMVLRSALFFLAYSVGLGVLLVAVHTAIGVLAIRGD